MAASGETSLTHRDLAKALGVSVTTIKSYRRKFPEFFTLESQGKPIRFPASSKALCQGIKRHFARGLSVEETRGRLAEEFEAHPVSPPERGPAGSRVLAAGEASAASPARETPPGDSLARMQDLLEGLFSLQNRTHSLLAELVAKLDTLADRLGEPGHDARAHVFAARPLAGPAALQDTRAKAASARATGNSTPHAGGRPGGGLASGLAAAGRGAGAAASVPAAPGGPDGASQAPDALASAPCVPAGNGEARPPAPFLAMPVVVRSGDGEFLGVTRRPGEPFTLAQFERYLTVRAGEMGSVTATWENRDEEWVLRLETGGQVHDHHFIQAVTPRGNTVARFMALSVGGVPASEAALQAFLRHVKESLS
jgi:hypothetical protein